jgi:hypothetical protein
MKDHDSGHSPTGRGERASDILDTFSDQQNGKET